MTDRPALSTRIATPEDLKFVRASWFESYKQGGYAPQAAFPIYRAGQDAIIERCLAASRTFVAYATEVPDEVCSWVCIEGSRLHYVYTKLAYRRLGMALQLAYSNFTDLTEHTHDTRVGRSFTARIRTKFNPYPLYNMQRSIHDSAETRPAQVPAFRRD